MLATRFRCLPRARAGQALALLLLPGAAMAQADSPSCRIECAAPFTERAQNTVTIQTCLVRCAARTAALGAANPTGFTNMPQPQTPWTATPGARPAPQTVAVAQTGRAGPRGGRSSPAAARNAAPATPPSPARRPSPAR